MQNGAHGVAPGSFSERLFHSNEFLNFSVFPVAKIGRKNGGRASAGARRRSPPPHPLTGVERVEDAARTTKRLAANPRLPYSGFPGGAEDCRIGRCRDYRHDKRLRHNMISPQDIAVNLAAFVAAAFNAIQIPFMFWVGRHRDGKELSYWLNYAVHPLYFVCMSFAFAALFLP